MHGIAPKEELFNLYCSARRIDFSEVAVPFFKLRYDSFQLFPLSNSRIVELLKIKNDFHKTLGRDVWTQYDNQEFDKIEKRNLNEVILNYKIYSKIRNKVRLTKKAKKRKSN